MKSDVYKINNAVEKIKTGKNTQFLDGRELKIVTGKLKKSEYNVYYPYKDSEKVMLYTGKVPIVKLFRINTAKKIRHQDILGSLFALNIDSSYFGDIVLYDDDYYVYIENTLATYVKDNLNMIGNKKVILEEVKYVVSQSVFENINVKEVIFSTKEHNNIVSVKKS